MSYIPPAQFAAKVQMHPVTIRKLCREGKLDAVKIGGRWRVRWEDPPRAADATGQVTEGTITEGL